MKLRLLALVGCALLAACGGGGGSNPVPVIQPTPVHTVAPSPSQSPAILPQTSGKPMAFANSAAATKAQASIRRVAAVHAMDATPTPSASPAAPTPSPTPTVAPLPSPSGNPLYPNRIAIANGFNLSAGVGATVEVLDPTTNQTVPEPSAPTWVSDHYWWINPTGATPWSANPAYPDLKDAWSIAFQVTGGLPPYHDKIAFTFPDSTGIMDVFSYDGFVLSLSTPAVAFNANGVAQAASAGSEDVSYSSAGLHFPNGFQEVGAADSNRFGDPTPGLNDWLAVGTYTPSGTDLAFQDFCIGCVYQTKDTHGVYHKFLIANASGDGVTLYQLAADVTNTYPF